jgi:hypothetical protein
VLILCVEPVRVARYAEATCAFRGCELTHPAGNDPELDPDREPEPPTKAVEKPAARTGKRNAPAEAPASRTTAGGSSARGGQRDGYNANDNGMSGLH